MNKRRGRPHAGTADGRDRLLAAARDLFAVHGYDGATLRMIAAQADCDPALVAHHFGSKKELFARAMALSLGPSLVLEKALEGDPRGAPERLAAYVVRAWERPEVEQSLVRLVQAGMQHPEVLRAFRGYIETEIVDRLVEHFGGPSATDRATAMVTLVIGIVFGRYVIGVGPLRSMPPDRFVRALGPSLRAMSPPPGPPTSGHRRA